MFKSNFHKFFIGCCSGLLVAVICFAVFLKLNKVEAATCGDSIGACACGDTVISNYKFTSDLTCSGNGLIIGADNIILDGDNYNLNFSGPLTSSRNYDAITGTGYSNITIKNLKINGLFRYGIYINGVFGSPITNILVRDNVITDSRFAIWMTYANNSSVLANTISKADQNSVFITGVNSFDFSDNSIFYPSNVLLQFSSGTIGNNTFTRGRKLPSTFTGATITNNQFIDSAQSRMIAWTTTGQETTYNIGDSIPIDFLLKDINGNSCPSPASCSYTLDTYPTETISHSVTSDHVTGSFSPSRNGTYTLKVTAQDAANNYFEKKYRYLVGPNQNITTRYYFSPQLPAHGQGSGTDDRAMTLTAPTGNDEWQCDVWVGNALDQIPAYPLALIDHVDYQSWYRNIPRPQPAANGAGTPNAFGLQKYAGYDQLYDFGGAFDVPFLLYNKPYVYAEAGAKVTKSLAGLNIPINYPWTWYDLEFKFFSQTYNDGPDLQTFIADPSYADFNYTYTTNPEIKEFNNDNITILSATQDALNDPNSTNIILEGTGDADIKLDTFNQPFPIYTSTIATDGAGVTSTTIHLTGLSGVATVNDPVNLQITPPNNESIDVVVNTWQTSGLYYKKWSEAGAGTNLNTAHTVSDLRPNTNYPVKVDGVLYGTYLTNGSGVLTFNYTGGYSTKTFEVGVPGGGGGNLFQGTIGISINNDDESTTSPAVTINLIASSAKSMLISDNENFDGAAWEPFTETKAWTFDSSLGTKTIYAKFRNDWGYDSPIISDSINLIAEEVVIPPITEPTLCQENLPQNINIGDLLKVADSKTVYFVGVDNCRHSFPNEPTYFTWFADFSGILTVPMETISQIKLGKNVTVRPGTALVKIQSQPQVYMVSPGAKLRAIESETLALQLFGYNWQNLVIDIPDTFFTDYTIGEPSQVYSDGALIQYANDDKIYYLDKGQKMLISQELIYKLFQIKYIVHNINNTISYPTGLDFPDSTLAEIMNWQ